MKYPGGMTKPKQQSTTILACGSPKYENLTILAKLDKGGSLFTCHALTAPAKI